jgi:hypothetical protein
VPCRPGSCRSRRSKSLSVRIWYVRGSWPQTARAGGGRGRVRPPAPCLRVPASRSGLRPLSPAPGPGRPEASPRRGLRSGVRVLPDTPFSPGRWTACAGRGPGVPGATLQGDSHVGVTARLGRDRFRGQDRRARNRPGRPSRLDTAAGGVRGGEDGQRDRTGWWLCHGYAVIAGFGALSLPAVRRSRLRTLD